MLRKFSGRILLLVYLIYFLKILKQIFRFFSKDRFMCATELSAKAAKSTCRTNILCKGELTLFAHKCKFIYFLKRIQRIEKIYTHTHTHTYTPLVVQMVKKSVMQEDLGLIHGTGRSPGEGNGYPLQYSCPENYMDRET